MNKADLILALADQENLSHVEAEKAINGALELIKKALIAGEEVKLSGFGIFAKKERPARVGTNPSTREKIVIPASKSVTFKPSKALKAEL